MKKDPDQAFGHFSQVYFVFSINSLVILDAEWCGRSMVQDNKAYDHFCLELHFSAILQAPIEHIYQFLGNSFSTISAIHIK